MTGPDKIPTQGSRSLLHWRQLSRIVTRGHWQKEILPRVPKGRTLDAGAWSPGPTALGPCLFQPDPFAVTN